MLWKIEEKRILGTLRSDKLITESCFIAASSAHQRRPNEGRGPNYPGMLWINRPDIVLTGGSENAPPPYLGIYVPKGFHSDDQCYNHIWLMHTMLSNSREMWNWLVFGIWAFLEWYFQFSNFNAKKLIKLIVLYSQESSCPHVYRWARWNVKAGIEKCRHWIALPTIFHREESPPRGTPA